MSNNRKRILFVTHLYHPSIGGAEKLFQGMAEILSIRHNVSILTSNVKSTNDYFKKKQSYDLPSDFEIYNKVKIFRSNISSKFIPRIIHKFGFANKFLWFNYGSFFFGPYYSFSNLKKIINQKTDWIIAGPTPTTSLLYGVLLKWLSGAKLAIVPCMHTDDSLHTNKLSLFAINKADMVVTLTENENLFLKKRNISSDKICELGVAVDDYLLESSRKKYKETEFVLYLGQEGGHKNILLLIDAMILIWEKGYSNKLIIAGNRTDFSVFIDEKIKKIKKEYRNNLIRLNNITNDEKVILLDNCLFMINPSSHESFGIVFIEAWARRKAVIGANISAVNKLIEDGVDGLLFDDGNVLDLSAKINTIIDSPKLRKKYGLMGYKKVLNRFTSKSVSRKLNKFIS